MTSQHGTISSQQAFIQERRYLKGGSPKTVSWYQQSFKAFEGALPQPVGCDPATCKESIMIRIAELRDRGVSAISVNTYLCCVNAYFRWLYTERGEPLVRIPKLRMESKVLTTFSPQDIARLASYKPAGRSKRRLQTMVLTALDTGLRIGELLRLRRSDVDLDNLILRAMGKGSKERLVPMSIELRRVLYRWLQMLRDVQASALVFSTARGNGLGQRNVLPDLKLLCRESGIRGEVRASFHTFRHTFAVNYLRKGGNVLYLQRILGHSTLEMTNRYLRSLGIEDLKAVHNGLSILSANR